MIIDIEIDEKTGDIYLNRDHEIMIEIAKILSNNDTQDFKEFFDKKPLDIDGKKNYNAFCG